MIPENVHLTNLTPEFGEDGGVMLHLGVRSRSIADVTRFVERLEKSPLFGRVDIKVEEKSEPTVSQDVELTLNVVYYPRKEP
jgi:hypothetical protein